MYGSREREGVGGESYAEESERKSKGMGRSTLYRNMSPGPAMVLVSASSVAEEVMMT